MRTSGNKVTLIENKNTPAEVARINREKKEEKRGVIFQIITSLMDMTLEELHQMEDEITKVKCNRFNLLRYQYQLSEKQNAIN
ncbi:hypothetical protein [Candidatus Manganitrophus noduliformans]|uniref:Uncharacterized protein n=1 Tax=Candidatus Manganitrophus noduliformans TaxID=2606439 RepID=A0A7X6DPZ3_9BACT|nr:hypothetical protein [Candidatus Manganitrophus noduliformans]NKE71247.1 hypothetical protein [Candidatus Manganitrophus noduliformans]